MFEKIFPNLVVKPNGEANVCCPFPHDKGYEQNPSAHINVEKRLFHCKTCQAEGRFGGGGLSETSFVAEYYGVSYEQAIKLISLLDNSNELELEQWSYATEALYQNEDSLKFLRVDRGIYDETIRKYRLGYTGDGVMYPVIVHGQLCDVRTYNYNRQEGEPKIRSRKGASPLLFPFDEWLHDERPTLLCAGENDALLARQLGFNALTVTAGEGNFPKMFANLFTGKEVYICYDCDEAGRKGSRSVAFILSEVGATVHMVDLGLEGTKDSKDFTDFILKHDKSRKDVVTKLENALPYSEEDYQEDKDVVYPVINLWDVAEGKYAGRRVSARVLLSGKYDSAMQTPTAIEWQCNNPQLNKESSPCHTCPFQNKSGWWTLEENLKDLMELVDVNEQQQDKAINKFIGVPAKCPSIRKQVKSRKPVYKVVFTPDVPSEETEEYRAVEQYAYTLGLNLQDGERYRAFFNPYAHPLDCQRLFLIVDRL